MHASCGPKKEFESRTLSKQMLFQNSVVFMTPLGDPADFRGPLGQVWIFWLLGYIGYHVLWKARGAE